MKTKQSSGTHHPRAAFSLVETVLALGIMALAITALLGLVPHGLEMSRKAANAASETRIVDTILGQLSNIPFNNVKDQDKMELHFDDQVEEVDDTVDANQSTYIARVLVANPPGGPTGFTLPGSPAGQAEMWRVQVQIVQSPLRHFNFDAAPPKSFTTVPVVLAPLAP